MQIHSLTGGDYEEVVLNEAFAPDNQDEMMCFDVMVTGDSIVEESEVFFVSLSSEDSAIRIPEEASVLSITIVDNDSKYSGEGYEFPCSNFQIVALLVFMEQPSYTVDEATGKVDVCVVLEGTMETNLSLSLVTVDMSATGTVLF